MQSKTKQTIKSRKKTLDPLEESILFKNFLLPALDHRIERCTYLDITQTLSYFALFKMKIFTRPNFKLGRCMLCHTKN